jgi:hypothetical protein
MLGFIEKCKICRKKSFYIMRRSYDYYWLPIRRVTSQEKICRTCKWNVVKMIKGTNPPPEKLWKTKLKKLLSKGK